MTAHSLATIALKFVVGFVTPILTLATAGCGEGGESLPRSVTTEHTPKERFRQKVLQLAGQIDSDEYRFKESAYALFKDVTGDAAIECYEDLADIYVQAVKGLNFEIEKAAMGDEKESACLDSRLRNLWSITQWAASAVFYHHPESMEGWNLLIDVVLKYRRAASAAGMAMERLDADNPLQRRQYRRHFLFKREMTAMAEVNICTIRVMYEGCRHRLTPQQRKSVCHKVRTALGELPSEMAKDDAETLTKDTEAK